MSVAKVTEITAGAKTSFEDAILEGLSRATKTLDDIQGAWVKEQYVTVKDQKIHEFRVTLKVTFILHE